MSEVVGSQLHRAFQLDFETGKSPEMDRRNMERAAVRAQYNLPATGSVNYDSPAGRAALVAVALKQGISQCVSMILVGGLDTRALSAVSATGTTPACLAIGAPLSYRSGTANGTSWLLAF